MQLLILSCDHHLPVYCRQCLGGLETSAAQTGSHFPRSVFYDLKQEEHHKINEMHI